MKFLDFIGLEHLITEIKAKYVQKVTGKDLSANDFTNTLKGKLDSVENGAQVNEVSAADLSAHTEATGNVHSIPKATIADPGLMSSNDKTKLEGIASGAEVNEVSAAEFTAHTGATGNVHSILNATGSTNGLMASTDKQKIDTVETNAAANVLETIKRNGTVLTIDGNKAVDINIPTKYSDLTNDKNFKTEAEITTMISTLGKIKKEVVTSLPALGSADENTIYFLSTGSGAGHEEWMVLNGAWEMIGDTGAIDLSGYLKVADMVAITNAEIDTFINA